MQNQPTTPQELTEYLNKYKGLRGQVMAYAKTEGIQREDSNRIIALIAEIQIMKDILSQGLVTEPQHWQTLVQKLVLKVEKLKSLFTQVTGEVIVDW